jgi:hypothetical protein
MKMPLKKLSVALALAIVATEGALQKESRAESKPVSESPANPEIEQILKKYVFTLDNDGNLHQESVNPDDPDPVRCVWNFKDQVVAFPLPEKRFVDFSDVPGNIMEIVKGIRNKLMAMPGGDRVVPSPGEAPYETPIPIPLQQEECAPPPTVSI